MEVPCLVGCCARGPYRRGGSSNARRRDDAQLLSRPRASSRRRRSSSAAGPTRPITIDGKADEEAWKHAQVIDHFYLPWLGKNARAAKTATKAKLLWDREYLYFFADMEDTDLYADVKEHDGMTLGQRRLRAVLQAGRRQARLLRVPGQRRRDHHGHVPAAPRRRRLSALQERRRFHVEAKVVLRGTLNNWPTRTRAGRSRAAFPGSDFLRTGGRPELDERWKFALCRYDYSVDFEGPELSTCAPLKSLTCRLPPLRGLRHAPLRRSRRQGRRPALRHRAPHAADDLAASSARPSRRRPTASRASTPT